MKTAISLPDATFRQAERLARRLGRSRSALYREALEEFVLRHDAETVTDMMNRAVAKAGGTSDGFGRAAARRVLARTEW